MARLNFYVHTPHIQGNRYALIDRRDEIVDKLKELGLRVSMTDDGTDIYMVDEGVPTLGDVVTGQAEPDDKAEEAKAELLRIQHERHVRGH